MDTTTSVQTRPASRYRPEIDGLRAVAVVPVILFHAGIPGFSGGFVGVDVFFVISGYLITSLMIAEARDGTLTIAGFYERRARRILPALVTVLAVTTLAAYLWLTPPELEAYADSLASVVLFISNFYFANHTGYFETGVMFKPLLHTWSLAVEEQYYLFAPPLFLLLYRRGGVRLLAIATVALTILSFACAVWNGSNDPLTNFFFTPSRIWEIMLGALAAIGLDRREVARVFPRWVVEGLALAGLCLIGVAVAVFDARTPFPGWPTLAPTIGAVLVVLFARPDTFAGRTLSLPPVVGVGLISYSAYLWHWPLIAFVTLRSGGAPSASALVCAIAASALLAALSWRYVERPFRDRRFLTRTAVFKVAATAFAGVLAVAATTSFGNGFPARYDEPERSFFRTGQELSLFRRDCRIDKWLRLDPLGPCVIGDRSQPPSILFWGDSHAEAAASGIGEELVRRGLSAAIEPLGLCPPLPGTVEGRGAYYDSLCAERNRAMFAALAADTSIKHVVLAGWWQYYASWGGLVPDDGPADADECLAAMALHDRGMEDALRLTVCRLNRLGKSVTIVRQVPTSTVKRIDAMFDHATGNIAALDDTFPFDRAKYDSQPMNAVLDRLAGEGVVVVDSYAALCDAAAATCPLIRNGLPIYRDINHVTTAGSRLLGETLVPTVLRER